MSNTRILIDRRQIAPRPDQARNLDLTGKMLGMAAEAILDMHGQLDIEIHVRRQQATVPGDHQHESIEKSVELAGVKIEISAVLSGGSPAKCLGTFQLRGSHKWRFEFMTADNKWSFFIAPNDERCGDPLLEYRNSGSHSYRRVAARNCMNIVTNEIEKYLDREKKMERI